MNPQQVQEQLRELEAWRRVNAEARRLGLEPVNNPKTVRLFNAIKMWGESFAHVRGRYIKRAKTNP